MSAVGGQSGQHMLVWSFSAFDPGCVKTQCCCYDSPVILREESMRRFVEEADRGQWTLLPECLDDFIDESNPVRMIDVFVDALDLAEMSFEGMEPPATGRPSYPPSSVFLQEFSCSGISMLRGHDDQFEAPCLLRAYPWQRPS